MTDLEEKLREKEESINRARKQLDEEYARHHKEMESEIREPKKELSLADQDATVKLCKLDGAMDEELGLLCPPLPKNDTKSEIKEDKLSNYELGKDMWK